jgi:hypothetical protein
MEGDQVRGQGDNGDVVTLLLRKRMREILPRIRKVLDEAEAAGAASPAEIAELRARLKEAERDVRALEAMDRDETEGSP